MKNLIAILMVSATLTACNTVAGVGEDVAGGARTVQGWIGN